MIITAFSSRVTNWPLFWISNALAAILVLASGLSHPFLPGLLITAAVVLLANLTMTSVRTTVGPAGVVVHYGLLGLPRFRYPIATIARAEAAKQSLSELGGLGVHWSPWSGTRLTIRPGSVLILHRNRGKAVTISCADPQGAVAVLDRCRQ